MELFKYKKPIPLMEKAKIFFAISVFPNPRISGAVDCSRVVVKLRQCDGFKFVDQNTQHVRDLFVLTTAENEMPLLIGKVLL